ncbi:MAG: type II toxin-antitoxin system RelE/ParE family toxin [Syntrophobacteraceae bacterium]|jgi:mRNA interferase RelE/StbE
MGDYKLILSRSVEHDVRKIGKATLGRILQAIRDLSKDPFPKGCRKLKGAESSYRIRIGDYRVLYEVDSTERLVSVLHIRHRKDAYRE